MEKALAWKNDGKKNGDDTAGGKCSDICIRKAWLIISCYDVTNYQYPNNITRDEIWTQGTTR